MILEDLDLRGAILQQVGTRPRYELELDVSLSKQPPQAMAAEGQRLTIRFDAIQNYANVERFFFGYRPRERKTGIDRIVEAKHTRVGWSIELEDRGRVAIKTSKAPTLELEAG
jgi:hypothetical protein